jgi:hypothetical protein
VDEDDKADYSAVQRITVPTSEGGNMVKALNYAAREVTSEYVGFIGDDHRFRTKDWDAIFLAQLETQGGGFVYGNDLFWKNGEIPTQVFMSSSIVKALGWMGLPSCKHLYIDNVWRVLGEGTSITYMPEVVIEHLHPATGKVKADEGHLRVNAPAMYDHDRAAFEEWQVNLAAQDIEIARQALGRVS